MFPIMEAIRSGGNLENIGGSSKYTKEIVCPDGCVIFKLTASPLNNKNFLRANFINKKYYGIIEIKRMRKSY